MFSSFTPAFSSFTPSTQMTVPAGGRPSSQQRSGHGPHQNASFLRTQSNGRGPQGTRHWQSSQTSEGCAPHSYRGKRNNAHNNREASATANQVNAGVGRGPRRNHANQPRRQHNQPRQFNSHGNRRPNHRNSLQKQGALTGRIGRRPRANQGITPVIEGNFLYLDVVMTDAPALRKTKLNPSNEDIAMTEAPPLRQKKSNRSPRRIQQARSNSNGMGIDSNSSFAVDNRDDCVMTDAPIF
ncbi:hypothetical protein P175DRAFT_0540896 [Aspergillus ochraceoroseus IBT 24754]|uniref:Uncharacterized protein n=1 Tax=Aspergillus ochraceoroseus IBT 24754 TaxID=1392256 RepID=A0A2T5LLW0_9EURO|nr:uncharacterized protein P175DRAFT_0540896 [Aspergillus ochraceoroseus IBT 24754]PTU17268.1 hypothetical protein P175DRAFT_0540896 [Aspergillus ochraceoroseus IBT 24754]